MKLYGTTALIDGKATGAFLIAKDNDEAASKALARLPEGGKLTHIIEFCKASRATLTRNKLGELCPASDQIEFTVETLLSMIGEMSRMNNELRNSISQILEIVTRLGLLQFSFAVSVPGPDGKQTQHHNVYHYDIEQAKTAAEKFTRKEYGDSARITNIQEVRK